MQKLSVHIRLTNGHREIISEQNLDVSDADANRIKELCNKRVAALYLNHIVESCGIKKPKEQKHRLS